MSGGIFDLSLCRIHEIQGCSDGYGNYLHDNQGIVQVICWQVIMNLKIFYCAKYFSKSSAMCLNNEVLPMGGFPYDLVLIRVRVVGRSVMFTEMRGLRLSLFGFGNRFLPEGK